MSIRDIISEVSAEQGVRAEEILGSSRAAPIARARHMVFHRARQQGHSARLIGYVMKRDHTSVLHGARKIEQEAR